MKKKTGETMEEGSDEEEATESKVEESSEKEGVTIPEEFQIKVSELIDECDDKACLSFIRNAVYAKEEELRKVEESKNKKNKVPSKYSVEDMPS